MSSDRGKRPNADWVDSLLDSTFLAGLAVLLKNPVLGLLVEHLTAAKTGKASSNWTWLRPGCMLHGAAACWAVAVLYVAPFYLVRSKHSRNHPETIKTRMLAVTFSSALSWIPLYILWQQKGAYAAGPDHDISFCSVLGLQSRGLLAASLRLHLTWPALTAWRALVVAPVTEEFVFRACMLPLLLMQGHSAVRAVLLTPLFFATAHLHHLRELTLHQGLAWKPALCIVAVQFGVTVLFGWYHAYY
ncbi:hypothetical protein WJX73_009523 [Symbiochloris irregularis]|uniref:intramembrane prenyl-peptidase Rce1 n=1 Tax=Symbiochloris irregularis TaxID=706552 RepID=A0AAW1PI68_9CHLO